MVDFARLQGSKPFWGPHSIKRGSTFKVKGDDGIVREFTCRSPEDYAAVQSPWSIVYVGTDVRPRADREADAKQKVKVADALTRIPGICDVKVSRSRKSKKESPANAGFEVIIPDGIELAAVTISITIWNEAQWEAMLALLDGIDPRAAGEEKTKGGVRTLDNVTSYDVSHPALNARKVRSIFVNSIAGPDYEAGGLVKFTINATEWVRPPTKPKAPVRKKVEDSKQITGSETLDGSASASSSGGTLGQFSKVTPPAPRKPGK